MKRLTNIITIISIILCIYYIYLHLVPFDLSKVILGIVSILLLIIPILIERFSKIKVEKYIKLIYYFFLLISFILGVVFQLYYRTLYFDLFVHTLFGLLLSIIIGSRLKVNSFKGFFLMLSIIVFIGFLWEGLEFFSDVFFNTDHQKKINGATDTMTDLLAAVLGNIIYCIYFSVMNKIKK